MADSLFKKVNKTETVNSTSMAGPEQMLQEPSDQEVRKVLDRIKAAREKSADPVDQQEFDKQEQEAQRLFDERANRAEWLGLADRIGNALVRIGAANAGLKEGVDLSQINYGKGYDQQAALDRAAKGYEMSIGQTGRRRKGALEQQSYQQDRLDREASSLAPELDFQKSKYGNQYDTYQQSLRDAASDKRRQSEITSQESREEARNKAREERDKKRLEEAEDKQLRALQVSDLQKQISGAEQDAEAAAQAAQILSSQDSLSKKSADKLMTNYPQIMSKAGITPEQMASIEERATEKGIIWDTVDPKVREQLIQQELIKPRQERIQNLRQALDKILAGRKPEGGQQEAPPAMIRMRHTATGKERDVTPEEAAKLPKDQFTVVK